MMKIEYVETKEEMINYLKYHYGEEITPEDVRGNCEIVFSNGREFDSDEIMIELGIGEDCEGNIIRE